MLDQSQRDDNGDDDGDDDDDDNDDTDDGHTKCTVDYRSGDTQALDTNCYKVINHDGDSY